MVTLRDVQWRLRRLLLGLLATALVFGTTLLISAVYDSFTSETDRAVAFFDADVWIVQRGVSGPFTSNSPLDAEVSTGLLRAQDGVVDVTPVAIFRHVVEGAGVGFRDVNVIAYPPGGVVSADPVAGREPRTAGEVTADERLGVAIGTQIRVGGQRLDVVGTVRGLTYNGGTPTVLVSLDQAQQIAFGGQPLANALVVRGDPSELPAELAAMTPTEVRDDLRRPLSAATGTLGILSVLLWLVAAGIVGFMSYLAGLDRTRDFAVFKAVGVNTDRLITSMVLETLFVAILAALLAGVWTILVVPVFPLAVTISPASFLRLVGVAAVIGLLASAVSVRQAVRVDPALAFSHG